MCFKISISIVLVGIALFAGTGLYYGILEPTKEEIPGFYWVGTTCLVFCGSSILAALLLAAWRN